MTVSVWVGKCIIGASLFSVVGNQQWVFRGEFIAPATLIRLHDHDSILKIKFTDQLIAQELLTIARLLIANAMVVGL